MESAFDPHRITPFLMASQRYPVSLPYGISEEFDGDTEKELRVVCKQCDLFVKILPGGYMSRHVAMCGRPCLGAGIPDEVKFHHPRCSLCLSVERHRLDSQS